MAVNSVGSTNGAVQQQLLATNQQAQVQRAERSEQAERPERTEQLKPVVNAQGQKTGTIINTTA